ncbi:MBL fold metallo-hydrolase [Streptomyces sp. MA5143a]|uniref:MBL fold metallo-hydrolase n=1 Tax=Streptomyces sp. MA5143a TaxID=2083010 RepID=UPI000D283155|nr:MBL fold metallo-hydrolase [Streptomyces sp. MA5143a]SPF06220.1 Metallo-beta-lactamase superfamily protein [Streptomyces sp. MA5143a]
MTPAQSPAPDTADTAGTARAVAPGVYAWIQHDGSWWINNAGFVTTDNHTVLSDTCATENRTRDLLGAVGRAAPGSPIRYLVNTHLHGDHAHGNSLLPRTTVVIAHEATREGILSDTVIDGCPPIWQPVPDWGAVTRRAPDLTIRTALTLHSHSHPIELHHPGHPAHTSGDLIV